MADASPRRIVQITAVAKDKYVNLYGLDESSRVWSWDPVKATWRPYKIEPRDRDRGF